MKKKWHVCTNCPHTRSTTGSCADSIVLDTFHYFDVVKKQYLIFIALTVKLQRRVFCAMSAQLKISTIVSLENKKKKD